MRTEFMTLADCVIPCNKYLWRCQNGLHVSWLRQPLFTNSYLISGDNLIDNFSIFLNVLILGSYSEYPLIYISSLEGNYVLNSWKKKVKWRTEDSIGKEVTWRKGKGNMKGKRMQGKECSRGREFPCWMWIYRGELYERNNREFKQQDLLAMHIKRKWTDDLHSSAVILNKVLDKSSL